MSELRGLLQSVYDERGKLTPQLVVEVARDPDHPLHHRFEWNDSVAAERWRHSQAHELIQKARVVYRQTPEKSVRAFHAVRSDSGYAYQPAEVVVSDDFTRRLVLADMEREWRQLRKRYEEFEEFADMIRRDLDAA